MDEPRRQLLTDMAERATLRGLPALEATIIRSRSLEGRDILAFLATDGVMDSASKLIEGLSTGNPRVRLTDPESALTLARVLTRSWITPGDRPAAIALFESIESTFGRDKFSTRDADLYAQTLLAEGHLTEASAVSDRLTLSETVHKAVRLDLLQVGSTEWLSLFNDLAGVGEEYSPIELAKDDASPFERLIASPAGSMEGPLVTVAVTAYRPGPWLMTSLRSIAKQSWKNLEIIVVDDGSGPEYEEWFEEARALDHRVRVVHLDANGGTYRARNAALLLASGEFFTVHDSDDWAHPDRIWANVQPLLEDRSLIATKGMCLSADGDLRVTDVGRPIILECGTTLTFRRAPVVAAIGYYDTVRKAADTEFEKRLLTHFRKSLRIQNDACLTIRRIGMGSRLSEQEFRSGWRHEARVAYASAYTGWHKQQRQLGKAPYVPAGERRFAHPHRYAVKSGAANKYDVVYYADWQSYDGPQKSMLAEIRALLASGARVAVSNVDPYRFMRSRYGHLNDPIRDLINSGKVEYLCLDDPAEIDLTIVRYPPVLQYPPVDQVRWVTSHVWIVANQAPTEADGSDRRYVVDDCTEHARRMFGVDPLWVPQGPRVRAALQADAPECHMAQFDNPSIMELADWYEEHRPDPGRPARIGRYSRDYPMKFPDSGDSLREIYLADDPRAFVRIMGGTNVVGELLDHAPVPGNWEILPYGAEEPQDFLRTIDFFVYYDHPGSMEAFGRSLLEAISAGVAVILHPKYLPVFGPAAIYAEPHEVDTAIGALWADPDAYREHVSRAMAHVQREFSADRFIQRIRDYVAFLRVGETSDRETFLLAPAGHPKPPAVKEHFDLGDHIASVEADAVACWTMPDTYPFGPTSRVVLIGGRRVSQHGASELARAIARGELTAANRSLPDGRWILIVNSDRHLTVVRSRTAEKVYWTSDMRGLLAATEKSQLAGLDAGSVNTLKPGHFVCFDKLTREAQSHEPSHRSSTRALRL